VPRMAPTRNRFDQRAPAVSVFLRRT
jgi:hypothetical protein